MLAKLESAYLSLLRVVILIAATVALVVAVIAAISALPPLLNWSGITHIAGPTGGTLADFISEKRITETEVAPGSSSTTEILVLPDIQEAAKNISEYLKKHEIEMDVEWEEVLQSYADQFYGHEDAYSNSIRDLSEQLKASVGSPLSADQVAEMVVWHRDRFQFDLETQGAREAQGNADFWITIGLAGSAFITFVLIIFVFLFVRIERSLRGVSVANVAGEQELIDA